MFNSGIKVSDLISELKNDIDVADPIADVTYYSIINSVQWLLYTEIIKEQTVVTLQNTADNDHILTGEPISKSELLDISGNNTFRFEDIYTVYADVLNEDGVGTIQLIKSTPTNGVIFSNTFYILDNRFVYHTDFIPLNLKVIYYAKPELITAENASTINISLPVEFIDLVKSKVRGEIYKLANEGAVASNWLNDYNYWVENFKVWIEARRPTLGM